MPFLTPNSPHWACDPFVFGFYSGVQRPAQRHFGIDLVTFLFEQRYSTLNECADRVKSKNRIVKEQITLSKHRILFFLKMKYFS